MAPKVLYNRLTGEPVCECTFWRLTPCPRHPERTHNHAELERLQASLGPEHGVTCDRCGLTLQGGRAQLLMEG